MKQLMSDSRPKKEMGIDLGCKRWQRKSKREIIDYEEENHKIL
jgi:hypothetical protein